MIRFDGEKDRADKVVNFRCRADGDTRDVVVT